MSEKSDGSFLSLADAFVVNYIKIIYTFGENKKERKQILIRKIIYSCVKFIMRGNVCKHVLDKMYVVILRNDFSNML